jgi:hypothetical protein
MHIKHIAMVHPYVSHQVLDIVSVNCHPAIEPSRILFSSHHHQGVVVHDEKG